MTHPQVAMSGLTIFLGSTPNPYSPDAGWFVTEWVNTPQTVVPASSAFDFMINGESGNVAVSGITHSEKYVEAMHWAHYPAMILSLLLDVIGILLAFMIYQWYKISADKLAEKFGALYRGSLNKWYFDEIYAATLIKGSIKSSSVLSWFDNKIIDGLVNGTATLTRFFSKVSGLFDTYIVDGLVNGTAFLSGFIGLNFKRIQTGKVQTYIVLVVFSILLLFFIIGPF
jgi:NADH-quinone oxidoreductase subunit L